MGCGSSTGSITIQEVTRDAVSRAVTAIAVTYDNACPDVKGELRWHSSVGYTAAVRSVPDLGFGVADIGVNTAGRR